MAMGPTSPLTPLFIDTNFDTHLIMAVSPQDTISDLKGKISTAHALCFPKIGEVSVQALKVKWGTSFYHLLDSLPLWFAFNGVTGNWLLHLDLVPAKSIVTSQTETARVITETSLLPEQHNVLQTDRDSSLLLVNGEDMNRDLVANAMPIKKGLIQTSIFNSHDRETLPDVPLPKPSAEGDSLVHNVSSPQKQNLHVSSHEIDRRSHADVPAMELCAEDVDAVGSNHQEKTWQVADQGNLERKGEDNGNVGTIADVDIPFVISKKEKSRKRTSPLQNDQLADGKSKKKRRKEKGQFSKEHVEDQLAEDRLETGFCSKEISQSGQHVEKTFQENHVTNLVPSEVFSTKPSHVDSSLQQTHIDLKQKKKKKKHLSKHEEASQDDQVRNPFGKTDATSGKHDDQENSRDGLVNNHGDLRKESDAADIVEESTKKVLDASSTDVGRTDPSSTNLKQSDCATERLLDSTTSTDIPIQDVTNDNGYSKALIKESIAADICKEVEQQSNHDPVDLEIPANSHRGKKKAKTEKDASSKEYATDSPVKPVNEGNNDEMSRNSDDKLSKVSSVAMSDADRDNTIPTKYAVPSEISGTSSQHSRKKHREKTELHSTQFNIHGTVLREQVPEENQNTVNSPRDQVPEENRNKTSSSHQQHPDNEFKGSHVPVPAAATGNSGLVTSTFPASPNDKKKKRSQKKSEKIELHHQELNLQSITHEPVNSSREQVTEECLKEQAIMHLERTCKEHKEAFIIGEAVENCTTVKSLVPSNHTDKKLKRKKKSGKIELPSGKSDRPESAHSLGGNVTEQTPKQSLEHDQNDKTDSHLRHPAEGYEGPGLFGEVAVDTDGATSLLNPSDKKLKRSRKKSGKSELTGKAVSKYETIHSLVKETPKENTAGTLNGSNGMAGMGENSNPETILRETVAIESTSEFDSVNTSAADCRNSCHEEKKKARTGLIDHSRNYDLDRSLASGQAPENLENVPRIITKSSGGESQVNSDEIGQNMDCAKPSKPDSMGLDDSSDKHEFGHLSAENATVDYAVELGKTREQTDTVTVQDKIHKGYESDRGKIDFFKFFDPKENQPEPLKELSSVETERKKSNKEKTKRKKKLNPSPLDSGLPKSAVSQEQYVHKKKSQDNDSGKHSLGETAVQIAEELKSRKKHGKKDANGTHDPDLHLHDTNSGIGSPRRPPDDDRPGKKAKAPESNEHVQVSISVDDDNTHHSRRNSMITGSQSLAHNAGNIIMVSASQVPKHNDFDASVNHSPGGALVTQNSSNTMANVTVDGDLSGLVASSDSTEEDTPVVRKRYRVAVRKVPHGKVQKKLNEEKTSLAPSATIFNNAGGSSEDEFEIRNRQTPTKAISHNSSTSDDSDGDLEETQTSYKIYPGAESIDYRKGNKGTNDARNGLAQSSNMKRRGKPLSTILKSTSSYKKAKLMASQSEFDDSESQDVIPETQPELAFL